MSNYTNILRFYPDFTGFENGFKTRAVFGQYDCVNTTIGEPYARYALGQRAQADYIHYSNILGCPLSLGPASERVYATDRQNRTGR